MTERSMTIVVVFELSTELNLKDANLQSDSY